ncbi:MAG: nucleotidyl transferase AbiEii/AbiGii toxin family protein [Deltaproteobacteria bacterium]|nr:nucleotidyl transferase AbiEii/AbiGii toxin family protein [Deltaproteobacteria bacterium]
MDRTPSGPGIKFQTTAILGTYFGASAQKGKLLAGSARKKNLGKEGEFMNFHPEVLGANQKKILRHLGPLTNHLGFYLGGGTALAIHLGHRHSVDLDWFSKESIPDPMRLAQDIRDAGISLATDRIDGGTLHGRISGVRVSFLEYRYPLLEPSIIWPQFGCRIASMADLSCMKFSALSQRGSKKDFIDVYALGLKYNSLPSMLRLYRKKFSIRDIAHVLYALSFFDDADREQMPRMLCPASWRTIKKTIHEWVREVVKENKLKFATEGTEITEF